MQLRAFEVDNGNERGERLLDFAEENTAVITKSFFQKPADRCWTWKAPVGETKNRTLTS